jgi:CheY-like chemotaxis protein/nitrogen-specific signal transduction histidine kinase
VVGVNIDVTQQRLAEQAVIAKEAAERANEAKTEFLSRMSHELRTPLNAILGFAQLLELNPAEPLSTQQRGNVEHIQKAGWHLVALIDEVLDLARIESGRMALSIERVALQGVIEESLALIHGDAAARGLHLEQHTLPDAPTHVAADRVRLKQVLANLLSNAVKYNRDNGLVAIEVAASHDGGARLTVRDTGRGMTAEQLARVFEPFNRLGLEHSGIAGTGIGLSISRKLVLQMKGAVEVTSEQGIGTRFVVTLPAAPVPEEARSVAIPVGSRRRDDVVGIVLYVEDNESNVRLVEQLLALRPGVKLVVASEAAGARVLAAVTQPDLVLIDMRLPDATGIEVLRDVRRQSYTAALPCIAVSANALPEEIAVARAAGFDDYLTKPLGAEQFLATIDAALVRHRGIDARTQA